MKVVRLLVDSNICKMKIGKNGNLKKKKKQSKGFCELENTKKKMKNMKIRENRNGRLKATGK